MKWSRFASVAAQVAIALAAAPVQAATPREKSAPAMVVLPTVEVRAVREPVEKSYRKIVKGMELFEQRRYHAPAAALRFKLLPRNRETDMRHIDLSIAGDNVDIPVPVAADNTFILERHPRAFEEDALVVPNRRVGTMTWRADIRTPGLPPNTRRLGDLRLECLVGMEAGLISNARSIFDQIAQFLTGVGLCDRAIPHYLFFADRPLWRVTLVHGNRREVLSVDDMYAGITRSPMTRGDLRYCDCEVLLDRTYYAPLGDRSWPDDTLLEFEYMDDGDAVVAEGSTETPAAARSP